MPKLPRPKVEVRSVARIAKAARAVTGIAKTVTCPVVTCPVKIRAAGVAAMMALAPGVVAMVVASERSK